MTYRQVEQHLRRRPFQPFSIQMTSGEEHAVSHPDLTILMPTVLIVGYPENDFAVHCALLHIACLKAHDPDVPVANTE